MILNTERAASLVIMVALAGSCYWPARRRGSNFTLKWGDKPSISINNQYGPISVKAGAKKEVVGNGDSPFR